MDPLGTQQWDAQGRPITTAAPPPPQGTAWDAQGNPIASQPASQPAKQPASQPAAGQPAPKLTDPTGEGTYLMQMNGQMAQIPYSRVPMAKQAGYTFGGETQIDPRFLMGGAGTRGLHITKAEAQYRADVEDDYAKRVARELLADPQGRELIEGDGLDLVLGAARHLTQSALGIKDIATKAGKTMIGAYSGGPLGSSAQPEKKSAVRQFAEEPAANFGEGMGGFAEDVGEFATGEELIGALGKVLGYAPSLAEAAKIEGEIKKGSAMGQLFKQALKQGAIGGTQSFVKTGGDVGAAAETGALTTGATMALGAAGAGAARMIKGGTPEAAKVIEGVEIPRGPKPEPMTPQQMAAGEAYGKHAGNTIRPDLERLNKAGERPVMMNQPGGNPAVQAGTVHAGVIPKIDINETLNRVGDYTRAKAELQDALNGATESIDKASNNAFTKLQGQVREARDAAFAGKPGATTTYQQKLGEMQALINKTPGMNSESKDAIAAGWRHYYALDDLTKGFDRAVNGVPGDSAVSQEQRGIYGKQLLDELNNVVRFHGRKAVEDALGGAERLKSLEEIGQASATNAGRKSLTTAMREVAKWIPAYVGAHVGWAVTRNAAGAIVGGIGGRGAAELGPGAFELVRNAVLSNPAIAKNLLYAAQYGAKPENYGPFIAQMIRKATEKQPPQQEESNNADETR